ncbi:putative Type II restriction enzyme, methylase subunits [Shewanella benthica]|uniref:site-specific DNA-methyltransferase (adenine-specific) n=1 Tax=Shewanella benthica TaxID=43661 RepID=A0A330M5M6_9GAMM|nr:BREX-1 system adenine-specific DNA-methyltransferase PglX [Shewanella benthica]SQH76704.1 putative Type II restriction enzyme, methylase subunits [Shewanella benthica]
MDTSRLKKFAQYARRSLIEQVQSKLKLVLTEDSLASREHPKVVRELSVKCQKMGETQLIEQVAYIWFNRFCALRFMDVNQYNRIMVVSPIAGQFQPEILAEAKAGHIDVSLVGDKAREKVFGLLSGTVSSRDGQTEAYRLMIVAVCNDYHRLMPYLFERIEDYTELLMPDDLLSGNSILAYTREAMTPENCESVESIGWLYQFYISEKKDQVFADLKKNIKISPKNIPAATQLFTPHWIVRYLVENSLGRLWMLNNPDSKVIEQMEYYIKPASDTNGKEQEEADFLKISSPEELKICDPACGSGHMLTYAYDLLYAIYLDANYDPVDIPELILTKNLYGIEIDERAAELAAFALSMKALKGNPADDSNNRRRFFRNPIKPNICHLEKVKIDDAELEQYMEFVGTDLFTQDLRTTLKEFEEADNFGSLIQPTLTNAHDVLAMLETKDVAGQLFIADTHESVLKVLKQADYLSPKYHVVVANPPYLGSKGMNVRLTKWAKDNYPDSKSDLFAMFIERDLKLTVKSGYSAMINMQSWMFLSSFEKLRSKILTQATITSMAHLGSRAFDSIGGEVVSTTAYVLENVSRPKSKGTYLRLVDGKSEAEKETGFKKSIGNLEERRRFHSSATDFFKIPSNPISYWANSAAFRAFDALQKFGDVADVKAGMSTSNNDRFLRYWYEVSSSSACYNCASSIEVNNSGFKWFPFHKGGGYRAWYGNLEYLVNWQNNGAEIKQAVVSNLGDPDTTHWSRRIYNTEYYFKPCITWSLIGGNNVAFRYSEEGAIISHKGPGIFFGSSNYETLCFLNSKTTKYFLGLMRQGLGIEVGHVSKVPFIDVVGGNTKPPQIDISKKDWNSFEVAWGFKKSPLLSIDDKSLNVSYEKLHSDWVAIVMEMKSLNEKNNQTFIDAYGFQDEMNSEVFLDEVTLNCNPYYRYDKNKSATELATLLLADTMREFISYSVGCMFGRYSLDKEGLILANQGETLESYLKQVPLPSFMPDKDNIIPIIDFDGDWFEDDITERFKTFLKVTFGEDNFAENLSFIEEALGSDGKPKDIKKFFVKDFYADHIKRYKKRPIYWLFSSPKGSFNALIYMHRYQSDTVSVILNDYLREFRTKLEARKDSYVQVEISASASPKDKTQAIKAITKINKVIAEIKDYEHDVLYPLAGQKIEIDLDDGVKYNYPLFGKALKKVPGLSK